MKVERGEGICNFLRKNVRKLSGKCMQFRLALRKMRRGYLDEEERPTVKLESSRRK